MRTPSAAAVAAVTAGFIRLVHIANGLIFSIGLLSIIVARGEKPAKVFEGITVRGLGARPKEHFMREPFVTTKVMHYFH